MFPTSFFQEKQAIKISFTIFSNEKTSFQAIKRRSSKSQKIAIFLKGLTHGFWTKMAIFAISFYQTNQAGKISFTIFQHENIPFQAIKTRSLKSQKIAIFLNWLTYVFGRKMAIFPTSICQAIQAKKRSLFSIFQNEKTPFQAIKTKSLKSRKIALF